MLLGCLKLRLTQVSIALIGPRSAGTTLSGHGPRNYLPTNCTRSDMIAEAKGAENNEPAQLTHSAHLPRGARDLELFRECDIMLHKCGLF